MVTVLLVATAIAVVVLAVLRARVFWANEAYLDDASGNWTALAKDFSQGILYRPLQGASGYGGSRYFPLHFVLHAAAMRLIGDPIRAGFVISSCSLALLMGGVYALLRRLGTPLLLAASCAAFVLVAHPAQEALLAIKGDGLAAALNVWGMAIAVGATTGGPGLLGAAALFALAFATKVTTVSGLGAAVLWLFVTGRRSAAVTLACATAIGMAIVLGLMYVGSHGVVFAVMRASASGGASIRDILSAPLTLAKQARRVPETLVFVQLGCAALLATLVRARPLSSPAPYLFVCVLAITTIIFGSPGTDTNHLIDLHVASIVMVGSWMATRRTPMADFAGAALLVAAMAASLSLVSGLANAKSEQRRGRFADALRLIPDTSRPILAQNPLVPVAAGQRAYVLDPFLIRVNMDKDPAFGDRLWRALEAQDFSAVVLERDPRADRNRELYRVILGDRFIDEVERFYVVAGTVGTRTIYLPRPR
jgi:hypothetical protein